ncbi:DinB/UmuC family translesion DNA polymerase [Streptomyces rishiriensis]|uniref:DinB/UmuC family translesion DNA polymerase n=1 Tax=Streptomyces rishiriensis TaxID=68264 RepID=UPI0037D3400D
MSRNSEDPGEPTLARSDVGDLRRRYRRFPHRGDPVLDGADVRSALLDLVVQGGHLLCGRGQVARGPTLVLKFAGGTSWEKTRRLPEPSAHEDDLRALAYRLMGPLGRSAVAWPHWR